MFYVVLVSFVWGYVARQTFAMPEDAIAFGTRAAGMDGVASVNSETEVQS